MTPDGTRPIQMILVSKNITHRGERVQGEGILDGAVETREGFGEDGPGRYDLADGTR